MANHKSEHNHKIGDELLAFGNPIDETEPEGVCKIVALHETSHYYEVRFEDEPEQTYSRFIH